MLLVKNFFCCLPLKTATIITGIMSLIFSMCFFIAIMLKIPNPLPSQRVRSNMYIIIEILTAITIIASLFLIVGAKNAKKKLLIPWMIITIINFFVALMYVVYELTVIGSNHKGLEIVAAICILIGMIMAAYLLLVVCSHYKEIQKWKSEKREEKSVEKKEEESDKRDDQ